MNVKKILAVAFLCFMQDSRNMSLATSLACVGKGDPQKSGQPPEKGFLQIFRIFSASDRKRTEYSGTYLNPALISLRGKSDSG